MTRQFIDTVTADYWFERILTLNVQPAILKNSAKLFLVKTVLILCSIFMAWYILRGIQPGISGLLGSIIFSVFSVTGIYLALRIFKKNLVLLLLILFLLILI